MPKQLFVDISELVNRDAKSGIQRVVRSILLQLLKAPPPGYLVEPVYSPHGDDLLYARRFVARFMGSSGLVIDSPICFSDGDIFLGLDFTPYLFPSLGPTLQKMRAGGVRVHYVVYDLIPLLHPVWHIPEMETGFATWLYFVSRCADNIVCISATVADEVREYFTESAYRLPSIGSFHLGADIDNSVPTRGLPDRADALLARLAENMSFLMVGTLEARKGHAHVLAAFENLWASGVDVNLVIVGKIGWNVDALLARLYAHPEAEKRLFFLECAGDEYLEKIYQVSTALIAASEAEGFGLPLVEAAQHNLPIIARDIPVFREVAGEHAFYFEGATLTQNLRTWLDLNSKGAAPKIEGMRWLTWAQSTEQLLDRVLPMGSLKIVEPSIGELKRVGRPHDGGYVIVDNIGEYDLLLSGGIGDDVSFERALLDMHPDLRCITFDGSISTVPGGQHTRMTWRKEFIGPDAADLRKEIGPCRDVFLKIDIEGGEYWQLDVLSFDEMQKFKQIVVEFHDPYDKHMSTLSKLRETHDLVHVHANNYAPTRSAHEVIVPSVFEATYTRKTLEPKKSCAVLPRSFDSINNPHSSDINMRGYPWPSDTR